MPWLSGLNLTPRHPPFMFPTRALKLPFFVASVSGKIKEVKNKR